MTDLNGFDHLWKQKKWRMTKLSCVWQKPSRNSNEKFNVHLASRQNNMSNPMLSIHMKSTLWGGLSWLFWHLQKTWTQRQNRLKFSKELSYSFYLQFREIKWTAFAVSFTVQDKNTTMGKLKRFPKQSFVALQKCERFLLQQWKLKLNGLEP